MQAKGGKGGANGRRKWRQTQAYGAVRRDERRRLVGGGCGRRTGGWCSAPGEEVRSGCYREVLRLRTAADGGAVGGGGDI